MTLGDIKDRVTNSKPADGKKWVDLQQLWF